MLRRKIRLGASCDDAWHSSGARQPKLDRNYKHCTPSRSSLRSLRLCGEIGARTFINRRDAENAEEAQRRS